MTKADFRAARAGDIWQSEGDMGGMRQIGFIGGVILILLGLLWAGQGSGLFPYPAVSPMINNTQWIWWGALLVVIGLALIVYIRRR